MVTPASSVALRDFLIGREKALGSKATPAHRFPGMASVTPNLGIHLPEEQKNSYARYNRSRVISKMGSVSISGDASYQHLPILLGMAVESKIGPTTCPDADEIKVRAQLNSGAFADIDLTTPYPLGAWTADQALYIGDSTRFQGMILELTSQEPAGSTANKIEKVQVSGAGATWIDTEIVLDTTSDGVKTFAKDGAIQWRIPDGWAQQAVDSDTAYWVRIKFSSTFPAQSIKKLMAGSCIRNHWEYSGSGLSASGVAPETYTLEYGESATSGAWWTCDSAFARSLSLDISPNQIVTVSAELMTNFPERDTRTNYNHIPYVIPIEDIVANNATIFIDDDWASVGSTEKAALISAASINIPDTGLNMLKTMNGSFRYDSIAENARTAELTLELLMGADALNEYDAWLNRTARAMRVRLRGPVVPAGSATEYFEFHFNIYGQYTNEPRLLGERDGNNVVELVLSSFQDPISGEDFNFSVFNDRLRN